MLALTFGLAAALAWGLHDLLVRRMAEGPNVLGQILVICATGAPLLLVLSGDEIGALPFRAWILAGLAGIGYVTAYLGLFRAFALAPARVVSPVLGAYPLLSLLIAAASGAEVTSGDWLAVLAVVAGIALVALLAGKDDKAGGALGPALAWAGLGACGFAVTFALGQAASVGGMSLAAGVVTRVAALLTTAALIAASRPSFGPIRRNWRLLISMGLLDTLALSLVMRAGGLDHAPYASVAASLFGVVTILLAWALLGERVRGPQWLGIGLVFAGIGFLAV